MALNSVNIMGNLTRDPELKTIPSGKSVCSLSIANNRVYTKNGELEISAVKPTKVVDTTGAGDAFRAGYFAGIFRNFSIKDSARFGASAASFVIEAKGSLTNVPDWADVLDRTRTANQ